MYCVHLMVLFAMHMPHGLDMNPWNFRVFEYRSYHSSSDSMHQYRDFGSLIYSTFTPFSTRTFFLCFGFTLHTISTNSPSIFSNMNLSSGMSSLRYASGASKFPHFFLRVYQLLGWWAGLPGKWSARMRFL